MFCASLAGDAGHMLACAASQAQYDDEQICSASLHCTQAQYLLSQQKLCSDCLLTCFSLSPNELILLISTKVCYVFFLL